LRCHITTATQIDTINMPIVNTTSANAISAPNEDNDASLNGTARDQSGRRDLKCASVWPITTRISQPPKPDGPSTAGIGIDCVLAAGGGGGSGQA
jgi:hypothetical protein